MGRGREIDEYKGKGRRLAGTALFAALLVGVQLGLIAWRGETACLNEGCRVVEGLTRVSPFTFNLFGASFFLTVALLAVFVRFLPSLLPFLRLLLLAAMAGEGVLLAYQYHVALAGCSYCLIIFGLVVLCNLMLGLRQFFSGIVLVAAVNIIFALLHFEPAMTDSSARGLEAGTAAVRAGTVAGPSVSLIYSNDCPHCMDLLGKLPDYPTCTVRLNPIGAPPPEEIPGLERMASYEPERNRDLLHLFQIDTVPVLVVMEDGAFRILKGESCIESYLACTCAAPGTSRNETSVLPGQGVSSEQGFQTLVPPADDKECRIDTNCSEEVPPPAKSFSLP